MRPPTAPATNWFHPLLLKLDHLVGLHPDDANYAKVKAEIAEIVKDSLTAAESVQLDATIKAIENARKVPVPPIPGPKPGPVSLPPPAIT